MYITDVTVPQRSDACNIPNKTSTHDSGYRKSHTPQLFKEKFTSLSVNRPYWCSVASLLHHVKLGTQVIRKVQLFRRVYRTLSFYAIQFTWSFLCCWKDCYIPRTKVGILHSHQPNTHCEIYEQRKIPPLHELGFFMFVPNSTWQMCDCHMT